MTDRLDVVPLGPNLPHHTHAHPPTPTPRNAMGHLGPRRGCHLHLVMSAGYNCARHTEHCVDLVHFAIAEHPHHVATSRSVQCAPSTGRDGGPRSSATTTTALRAASHNAEPCGHPDSHDKRKRAAQIPNTYNYHRARHALTPQKQTTVAAIWTLQTPRRAQCCETTHH